MSTISSDTSISDERRNSSQLIIDSRLAIQNLQNELEDERQKHQTALDELQSTQTQLNLQRQQVQSLQEEMEFKQDQETRLRTELAELNSGELALKSQCEALEADLVNYRTENENLHSSTKLLQQKLVQSDKIALDTKTELDRTKGETKVLSEQLKSCQISASELGVQLLSKENENSVKSREIESLLEQLKTASSSSKADTENLKKNFEKEIESLKGSKLVLEQTILKEETRRKALESEVDTLKSASETLQTATQFSNEQTQKRFEMASKEWEGAQRRFETNTQTEIGKLENRLSSLFKKERLLAELVQRSALKSQKSDGELCSAKKRSSELTSLLRKEIKSRKHSEHALRSLSQKFECARAEFATLREQLGQRALGLQEGQRALADTESELKARTGKLKRAYESVKDLTRARAQLNEELTRQSERTHALELELATLRGARTSEKESRETENVVKSDKSKEDAESNRKFAAREQELLENHSRNVSGLRATITSLQMKLDEQRLEATSAIRELESMQRIKEASSTEVEKALQLMKTVRSDHSPAECAEERTRLLSLLQTALETGADDNRAAAWYAQLLAKLEVLIQKFEEKLSEIVKLQHRKSRFQFD
eukprot:919057_1